jgi:hypothetical protein
MNSTFFFSGWFCAAGPPGSGWCGGVDPRSIWEPLPCETCINMIYYHFRWYLLYMFEEEARTSPSFGMLFFWVIELCVWKHGQTKNPPVQTCTWENRSNKQVRYIILPIKYDTTIWTRFNAGEANFPATFLKAWGKTGHLSKFNGTCQEWG